VTYCRLFPAIGTPFTYDAMERLGLSMRSNTNRMPDRPGPPPPPAAAYTYFGQFIFHDLTRDDTPLSESPMPDAGEIVNHRTPFLDLDSLYGGGPFSLDSTLYQDRDNVCFKLGAANTSGRPFDVPMDTLRRRPLIADSRNNENIVIRQIHALFLVLHNMAVKELRGTVPEEELFDKARQRIRWQYQWLVRYDYLRRICRKDVYADVIEQGNTRIVWGDCFAIPVEFSHAAARFGHSMVRPKYNLNRGKLNFPVVDLFAEAHRGEALHPDLAVDWGKFTRDPANSIDTTIVDALFNLSDESIHPFVALFTDFETKALPVRTLYRAIAMKICTGEMARDTLDPCGILCEPIGYDPFRDLRDLGLIGQTPLWYYLLLEAEVCEKGARLGPFGSRLIAEVIDGALRNDPHSILREMERDPAWRPATWKVGSIQVPIDNFQELTRVVGLLPD
jgi:hypothetical protein